MRQSTEIQEFTYLSKTNISQTILLLKEAQSYLQQQYAKELFEQPTKEDFLETTNVIYYENYIINEFANVLQQFSTSIDAGLQAFKNLQKRYPFADIYDAVENNFCFYFLALNVDIETFTNKKSKQALQNHYQEVQKIYKEIILFINSQNQ